MPSSNFTKDELVTKHGKTYPVAGGRLRLAHAAGLSGIRTESISFKDRDHATVYATVTMGRDVQVEGDVPYAQVFTAHGTATAARDGDRMKDSLLELAETRAVARALRYAGFGVEFTGAEEVSHVRGRDTAKATPAIAAATQAPSSQQPPRAAAAKGTQWSGHGNPQHPPGTNVALKDRRCSYEHCDGRQGELGRMIESTVWDFSIRNHGRPLCRACQEVAPRV